MSHIHLAATDKHQTPNTFNKKDSGVLNDFWEILRRLTRLVLSTHFLTHTIRHMENVSIKLS